VGVEKKEEEGTGATTMISGRNIRSVCCTFLPGVFLAMEER